MEKLTCIKCSHEWWPRFNYETQKASKPVQCPRCKTYKWEDTQANPQGA